MKLPQIRGLKYPDEFVIKFFFKHTLHTRTGNVLELGCGNGNNLHLFHEYGWSAIGLDVSRESLDDAEHNFSSVQPQESRHQFIQRDLTNGMGGASSAKFDVILLANILCYIPRSSVINVLQELNQRATPGALVFLRTRNTRDYRYQRGEEIERNGFYLAETETGEKGLLNVFYDEWEMVDMLRENLKLDMNTAEVLRVDFQNPQQGVVVDNSDIIIWGQIEK